MAASTAPKKYRSKWFRVAKEGATTDGRNIERQWIDEMAATYNRSTYGARIWMEHIRSVLPDSPFRAYGDVLALKAQDDEIDGKTVRTLYAQIEPTDDLVTMVNKLKQKIFTSIEVREKFADTGKAYFMGLGVTDTPASLATEVLSFAAQNPDANPLKARKQSPDNLFTACEEVEISFEEVADPSGVFSTLTKKVTELLSLNKEKEGTDAASFAALGKLIEQLATHGSEQATAFSAEQEARQALQTRFDALEVRFNTLSKQLGNTEDPAQEPRPPVSGTQPAKKDGDQSYVAGW